VMKHLGDKDDTTIRTKMEEMNGVILFLFYFFSIQEMNGNVEICICINKTILLCYVELNIPGYSSVFNWSIHFAFP
jgi:hypothetical protein